MSFGRIPVVPPQPGESQGLLRAWRLLLPLAVLLPLLVAGAAAWLAWRQAWREAEQDVTHAADASAEYARRVFDGLVLRIERANDLLAGLRDEEIRAREDELHQLLRHVAEAGPASDERPPYLYVYDREARALVSGTILPVPSAVPLPQRDFNQALRGPNPPPVFLSRSYVGVVTGEAYFALTRRRERTGNGLPPGAYDGVINASVYVADATMALRRLATEATGDVISLVRGDGEILARSLPIPPASRIGEGSPILPLIRQGAERAIFNGRSTVDGTERLVAYRKVPGYPVYVSAARPHAAILDRWSRALVPLLGTGLPATLALLGLALLVRRSQQELATANAGLERRVAARTLALSESEARFRAAIEGAPIPMMLHAADGAVLALSRSWSSLTGYAAADLPTHAEWTRRAFPPAEAASREAQRILAFAAGTPAKPEEVAVLTRDGHSRIWEVHDAPVGALPDGRRLRVSAAIDVTERRAAEERQALLAREVDHRAKNALAVVQAALRLTPRDDPERFFRTVEARVAALARAQGMLAETRWRGADLRALAEGSLAAFLSPAPGAPRAELSGPPVMLAATAVQPISLILHELATNAVKYGALSAPGGVVTLTWAIEPEAGLLRLHWTERGGPPLATLPRRRGFGSRIIEATARAQLGGRIEQRWLPEGLSCELAMPLDRTIATPRVAAE